MSQDCCYQADPVSRLHGVCHKSEEFLDQSTLSESLKSITDGAFKRLMKGLDKIKELWSGVSQIEMPKFFTAVGAVKVEEVGLNDELQSDESDQNEPQD